MPLEINGVPHRLEARVGSPEDSPLSSLAPLAATPRRQGFGFGAIRRGTIPHWTVPPPFPDRRKALVELGVERYKEAVHEYYSEIGRLGVQAAQATHARWVLRRCLGHFETQMRKFQRHWEERGYRDKDGRWLHEVNTQSNHGLLISPEEMYESSRMLADIELTLRAYQVREDLRPWVTSELRRKLRMLWELRGVSK
jgi:hypothetical protein